LKRRFPKFAYETTPATTPDDTMLAVVPASLAERHQLPAEHLVDKGYTDPGYRIARLP